MKTSIAGKVPQINTFRASIALFLLAMSILILEVTLTRVFSVISWHHFAYLIISLAFLGFGAASSYLTVSRRFSEKRLDEALITKYALAFSISIVLSFAITTKIRFYPMDVYKYDDYSNIFSLLLLYIIVGAPFFLGGTCIGYLISRAGDSINRLYFSDLIGAGAGTLISLIGINHLGVEATVYLAAAASGLAAVVYAWSAYRLPMRVCTVVTFMLVALLTIAAIGHEIFPVYSPPDKLFRSAMKPHYQKWNVVSKIDIVGPYNRPCGGGALSTKYTGAMPLTWWIYQDGQAPTGIMNLPDGDVMHLPILGYFLQGAPYVIKPNADDALIIGMGGGPDVMISLFHGTKKVVGVEVNPVTVDADLRKYADFSGNLFNRPNVEVVNAEGRHYLTTTKKKFDVIQLSGVDTYSALSVGAYALAENYLYTVEAMENYWRHLKDDGVLSFSRWLFTPPRETLRLVVIQLEALQRLGITNPEHHLLVIMGHPDDWAETLLKKSPFTKDEVEAYRQWARSMNFDILYDPYQPIDNIFNSVITASATERDEIIRQYPYNISVISDNNPFFFQFYRWRSLLHPIASKGGYYIEQMPLGLMVLLLSLGQILILSIAFILGPLVPQGSRLRGVRNKKHVLVYFAAIGLGFIFVEIALLQKYTIFVGGPIYSMAVTLFAILMFSGLGSLLGNRFRHSLQKSLPIMLLLLIGAIVAETAFVNYVVPHIMFLSQPTRFTVTVAALAPLGIMMGMPFPMGLRVVQRFDQTILPWAWGVNAVTTTLGSVLCVLASMYSGFSLALLAAAVIYFVGLLSIKPLLAQDVTDKESGEVVAEEVVADAAYSN